MGEKSDPERERRDLQPERAERLGFLRYLSPHRIQEESLAKYVCGNCGFIYDPVEGD
jgi:hypothetical protein